MTPTDSPRDTSAATSDDPASASTTSGSCVFRTRRATSEAAPGNVGVGVDGRCAAPERGEGPGLAVVSLERDGMCAGERGRAQADLAQNVIEVETGCELSGQVDERVQPARGSHSGSIGCGFGRLEHYRTGLRRSRALGARWTRSPCCSRSRLQSQQKGSNPANGGAVNTAFGPVP